MRKTISALLLILLCMIPAFNVFAQEANGYDSEPDDNIYRNYLLNDYADRFAGNPDKQQEFLQEVLQREEEGITVDTVMMENIYKYLSGITDPDTPRIIEQMDFESSAVSEAGIISLGETQTEIMQSGEPDSDSTGVTNRWLGPVKVCVNKAYYHSLVLNADGSVWASGNNLYGQLGNGTTTNSTTPVRVKDTDGVNYLSDIVDIAVGSYQSFALKSDGTVVGWGKNGVCKMGNNTTTDFYTLPTNVKQNNSNINSVIAISSGNNHCMALKSDGTVWTWGYNTYEQLGYNTYYEHGASAGKVRGENGVGYLSDVVAISAGGNHCLALKEDGTVWAWGYNNKGQLGDNTYTTREYPVQVTVENGTGYLSNIVAISAGEFYNLALSADGKVYGWGDSYYSQLGNGEYTLSFPSAIRVRGENGIGYLSNVKFISAGSCVSSFIKTDGTTYVCGCNDGGIIGTGTVGHRPYPTRLGVDNLSYISGGFFNTFAMAEDGRVWAWGNNQDGAFGIGSSGNIATTPVKAYTLETIYDDYLNNFTEAFTIQQDSFISGKLDYLNDKDYFKFTVDTSGEFIVEKNGINKNWVVELYDSSNKYISPFVNVYRLTAGETYFILIRQSMLWPVDSDYVYNFRVTPFTGAELEELDVSVKYFNDNYISESFLWGRHSLKARFDLKNTSSESKDVSLYLALYNAQNKIVNVASQNVTLASNEQKSSEVSISLPRIIEGCYVRPIVWDKNNSDYPHIVTELKKHGADAFNSSALHMEYGDSISGRINTPTDIDTFTFTAPSSFSYWVRATGNVTAGVYKSDGTLMPQSELYSFDSGHTYRVEISGNEGMYTFSVIPFGMIYENAVTLDNCEADKFYDVAINLDKVSEINRKEITITFDSSMLELYDMCTFSKTDVIFDRGTISGTDFKLVDIDMSEKYNKMIIAIDKETGDNTWSGTATVLRFRARENGSTTITTYID